MWPTPWAPSMRAQDTEFFADCHECFPREACTRECENCIEHGEFRPFALRLQVSDDRAEPTYDFVVFDRVANVDLVGLHQTGLGYRLKSFRTRSVNGGKRENHISLVERQVTKDGVNASRKSGDQLLDQPRFRPLDLSE